MTRLDKLPEQSDSAVGSRSAETRGLMYRTLSGTARGAVGVVGDTIHIGIDSFSHFLRRIIGKR